MLADKTTINMRDFVRNELNQSPKATAKYDIYRCPFHGETKGHSFVVYDDGYKCFGKCDESGDVYSFVMRHQGVDFHQARLYVHGNDAQFQSKPKAVTAGWLTLPASSEPPPADWQASAREIIAEAKDALWNHEGKRAMDYLTARGLKPGFILGADLGYIPGKHTEWRKIHGLNVPCGILIPWQYNGAIWGLKVRRAMGDPKYVQVAGGNIKGSLFNADSIISSLPMFVFEGEFDALIAYQSAYMQLNAVAVGSISNLKINRRWHELMVISSTVNVILDNDPAGKEQCQVIKKDPYTLGFHAKPSVIVFGKDLNEMYLDRGERTVQNYLLGWCS